MELMGRFGALRVRSKRYDITLVAAYHPLWDRGVATKGYARRVARAIQKQLDRVVAETASRST
eukprot:744375-Lingulodinium_polyedra.AAC.1